MKIFLGNLYHGGGAVPGSRSIHLRVANQIRYPHVFESFAYANDRMVQAIRHNRQRVFFDSGAFSRDVKIKLRPYAKFIREHHDIIDGVCNLDAIGIGDGWLSYDRQKELETLLKPDGLDRLVMPIHHVRDHDDWLRRYLDEGYQYIGLGGMVFESSKTRRRWLDYVWRKFLSNPDGTPKVRVHGLGLSSPDLLFRYPWYSTDATTWFRASRFGWMWMDILLEDGSIADVKIDFSERSPRQHIANSWHYFSLHPDDRRKVDRRLKQLEAQRIRDPELEADFKTEFGCTMGFNPAALGMFLWITGHRLR